MQQHVGLAPHDARRRARRVDQHGVERRAIPPGFQADRVGSEQARIGADPYPREGTAHTLQAGGIHIQRDQAQRGIPLQQMRRLAARRGAGVEHARTGHQRQRIGDALCGQVLHRHRALGEARQLGDGETGIEAQRIGGGVIDVRRNARVEQALAIGIARLLQPVDAQPQGRHLRAGFEDARVLLRPVLLQALSQPLRPMRGGIAGRQAIALRAAQQRVDHACLVGAAQRSRGFHRRRHRGVRRQGQRIELGEADVQQRAQFVVAPAERTRNPCLQCALETRWMTQHREADRLDQGAITRVAQRRQVRGQLGLERTAAMQHGVEHTRRHDPRRGTAAHAPLRSGRPLR